MYKLHHYPLDIDYYFYNRPTIENMKNILKKLGYKFNKNGKAIEDNNGISIDWNTREEFQIEKIKFYDTPLT